MIKLKQLIKEGILEQIAVEFISNLVKNSPFKGKAYIAGGYVRDELLGLDPKDIDIVVEMDNGGIKFADWITKKLNIYKNGSNPVIYPTYGTASFVLKGIQYKGYNLSDIKIEVVMTRKEKYQYGNRKPEVSAGTLYDDVTRRDFTVNSLLKDLTTGEILDLTGMGKKDIKDGIVRTPLNPDIIFTDDPLRMLRAIRFTVKYGWKLPLFMIRALKRNAHMLKTISAERVRDELNKMLISKNPDIAIRLLQLTGLNKFVAVELDNLIKLQQNKYHKYDAMVHTLDVLKKVPPELEIRLAALFHDIGKYETQQIINNEITFYTHEKISSDIAKRIMIRLKYPNEIINKVIIAIKNHMRTKQFGNESEIVSDKTIRKLKNDLGDHLETTLQLIHADNISHSDEFSMPNQIPKLRDKLNQMKDESSKPILPINGNDIMTYLNIKPGYIIKHLLNQVKDAYFENPKLSKEEALNIIKKEYEKTI